jgi:hypothetical protein
VARERRGPGRERDREREKVRDVVGRERARERRVSGISAREVSRRAPQEQLICSSSPEIDRRAGGGGEEEQGQEQEKKKKKKRRMRKVYSKQKAMNGVTLCATAQRRHRLDMLSSAVLGPCRVRRSRSGGG